MVYLLFPILFMLHDFEEIIWGHSWLKKNIYLIDIPKVIQKGLMYVAKLSTRQFSFVVMEEFILCSTISISAFFGKLRWLFLGVMVGYFLHCIMHVLQCLYLKRYIPLVISAIITGLLVGITLWYFLINGLSIMTILGDGLIAGIIIVINLFLAFLIAKFV